MTTMEVIQNHKGGKKLLHEGYMYTKKYQSKSTMRWECSNRVSFSCKGAVTTDIEIRTVKCTVPHSHDSNPDSVAACRLKSTMKNISGTSRGTPTQILVDTTATATTEIRAALGNPESVKRTLRRERAKYLPLNPQSLQDLVIENQWTTTGGDNPHNFLIYDNGAASLNRMIVFATDEGLTHLARSDVWYMDGTFNSAPLLFHQLYVIRAPLGDSSISCVYAFLSNKSQSTYEELLQSIQNKCQELGFQSDPSTVITDYELAIINAVNSTFGPHTKSHGCFYHLTQNTWRKIQGLGLVHLYLVNDEVKLFCGMLDMVWHFCHK